MLHLNPDAIGLRGRNEDAMLVGGGRGECEKRGC